MSEPLKAAFIFIAPEADPTTHRGWIETPAVHLLAVGVKSYEQAVVLAERLVSEEGIAAIELCGGFGNAGTAKIAAAVNVPVGVVRFDIHPGLGGKSGDDLFG